MLKTLLISAILGATASMAHAFYQDGSQSSGKSATISRAASAAASRANDIADSFVTSSQLIASAQQIRTASLLAKSDNADVHVLDDLVAQKYLSAVPLPYPGDARIDGGRVELRTTSFSLCLAMERKAGGAKSVVPSEPSKNAYGCYLAEGQPRVFYVL